ncbi:hypothetical protein CBI36_13405 [Acetobacter oryzifermentans]|uniref:Uncharacterized protein n=2 Tax=Acetobacter TaxID=434 RepID=A0AAN1PFS2_9PROT|nr:hypothetical protein CBI36_13405 [Acetobacter oryzifermentans]AXM99400.1 hypothetical protein CJF59_01530 [Acetobacter pomorum]
MTDFHETNHAAGAGSRHADSVRRKTGAGGDTVIVHAVPQPLRSQGILNDIVPEPSSCAFAEEKTVSATAFPATETAGRSASEFSQDILESCSLTSASSASSHSAFRPVVWAVFAIILAIIISIARRWPRKFSIESSFHVVDAPMMDVASSGINAAAGTPDFQKNVTAGVVA